MSERIKVMLATEGTYPFHHGGVSTWCDSLINQLRDDMDFTVYCVMMNPYVTQKFTLPPNCGLIKMPLWGTEEPKEHLDLPFSDTYKTRKKTTAKVIRETFLPLFIELMKEICTPKKDSNRLGKILVELHNYYEAYDYKDTMKSKIVWDAYKELIQEISQDVEMRMENPGVYGMIHSLGWMYRFFTLLTTPMPRVDIAHSTAAAFCSVACVISKLKYGSDFLLTEHGVYLREQYLFLSKRGYSSFLNTFLIRMIHSVVDLSYHYADQVSPVCDYNTRWEKMLGVDAERIRIIYNGISTNFTKVHHRERHEGQDILIASVARIDPIKDIKTFIRSAKYVLDQRTDVRFEVHGSVTVPAYNDECIDLIKELGLTEKVKLCGHNDDIAKVYEAADIIVLTSVSEAFPYSVIEAMMAGKTVVATDVGGVSEALKDVGILVPPLSPEIVGMELLNLLENTDQLSILGIQAQERALSLFNNRNFYGGYFKSYVQLALKAYRKKGRVSIVKEKTKAQWAAEIKLGVERGWALASVGFYREALVQLEMAAQKSKNTLILPYIYSEIASIQENLGHLELKEFYLEKAYLVNELMGRRG